MFDAQEILTSERDDIINKLEKKLEDLESESERINTRLESVLEENEKYKEFTKVIFPELITDRLKGVNVSIIDTSSDYNYLDVKSMMELAGAKVNMISLYDKNIINNLNLVKDQLLDYESKMSDMEFIQSVLPELINEVIYNRVDGTISQLNKRNIIKIERNFDEETDYYILAGGAKITKDKKSQAISSSILDYLLKINHHVIAIEKENVEVSYMDSYKDREISTIDNVNTEIGMVSLIFTIEDDLENSINVTIAERK